jgi:hypothetical protein
MDYWEYPRYVPVAEKRARAEKKLKQLLKKNPGMRPVVIEGRAIARTWWGKFVRREPKAAQTVAAGSTPPQRGRTIDRSSRPSRPRGTSATMRP